ncbi:MAG: asparaginase, partial [Burkholderiales bacterium]
VSKVGADGVQAIGVRSAGLGIAVKVSDGNGRVACLAAIEVLRQLGLLAGRAEALLAPWARQTLRNAAGHATGELRPALRLARSAPDRRAHAAAARADARAGRDPAGAGR